MWLRSSFLNPVYLRNILCYVEWVGGRGGGCHMKGTIMAGGIGMESQNIVICTNYVTLVNPPLVTPPPPHSWITMRSFILMNFCISLLLYLVFLPYYHVLSYDHVTHALSFQSFFVDGYHKIIYPSLGIVIICQF